MLVPLHTPFILHVLLIRSIFSVHDKLSQVYIITRSDSKCHNLPSYNYHDVQKPVFSVQTQEFMIGKESSLIYGQFSVFFSSFFGGDNAPRVLCHYIIEDGFLPCCDGAYAGLHQVDDLVLRG